MPAKMPAVGASAGTEATRGERGFCGRDEEDGGEEMAAAPLEAQRALLPVVWVRVANFSTSQRCFFFPPPKTPVQKI